MHSYRCYKTQSLKQKGIIKLSSLLKLVADESRLKILCILQGGTHCVCEIQAHLNLSQSLISHHLKDLRDAELIKFTKEKNKVYYLLTEKGQTITDILFKIPIVIHK